MTRHTVDTITSDQLDALYERLERAEETLFRAREVARWMRRNYPGLRLANDTLATALDGEQPAPATAATGAIGYCPACGRGDVAPSPEEYEQQRQRAEQAEAALARVHDLAAAIDAGAPWTANRADTAARIRAAIAGPGTAATEATVPRALFDENARRHQAAVDRVDELLAAIERVRKVATAIRDATAAGRNDWQIGQHDCALTILAALTEPAPAATGATGHRYLSTGCRHGEHGYCSNVDGT